MTVTADTNNNNEEDQRYMIKKTKLNQQKEQNDT